MGLKIGAMSTLSAPLTPCSALLAGFYIRPNRLKHTALKLAPRWSQAPTISRMKLEVAILTTLSWHALLA
ncbi:MAG TPA: hypothetical protein VHR47_07160 [Bacillota bacterium]|nr:hypothetical protein [Bacillota bacterium]